MASAAQADDDFQAKHSGAPSSRSLSNQAVPPTPVTPAPTPATVATPGAATPGTTSRRTYATKRSVSFNDIDSSSSGSASVGHEDSNDSQAAAEALSANVNEILKNRQPWGSEVFMYDGHYLNLLLMAFGLSGIDDGEEQLERQHTLAVESTFRGVCYRVSTNYWFKIFFGSVLGFNLLIMAVEADVTVHTAVYPDSRDFITFLKFHLIADHIFHVLFVIEIIFRFFGCPTKPWRDHWLVADIFVVGMSVLEIWILAIIYAQENNPFSSITVFRGIRVMRATRALRTFRIFRYVQQLRLMAEAIGEALRQIFWILIVALIFAWCFAIILVEGVDPWSIHNWGQVPDSGMVEPGHPSAELPHLMFERVTSSLFFLNLLLVRGITWGPRILEPTLFSDEMEYVCVGFIMLFFILAVTVLIFNLTNGVFMSALLENQKKDTTFQWRQSLVSGDVSVQELKRGFTNFDVKGDGVLTREDFLKGVVMFPGFFAKFGLRPDKARIIYRLLDANRSGVLTVDEFLIGCLKLVSTTRSLDMLCTDYMVTKTMQVLFKLGQRYETEFSRTMPSLSRAENDLEKLMKSTEKLIKKGRACLEEGVADDDELLERVSQKKRSVRLKPGGEEVMDDLQERFHFKNRMQALTLSVGEKRKKEDGHIENLIGGPRTAVAGGNSNYSQVGQLWDTVLFEEALPWVREHLVVARQKLAERDAEAARKHAESVAKHREAHREKRKPTISDIAFHVASEDVRLGGERLPPGAAKPWAAPSSALVTPEAGKAVSAVLSKAKDHVVPASAPSKTKEAVPGKRFLLSPFTLRPVGAELKDPAGKNRGRSGGSTPAEKEGEEAVQKERISHEEGQAEVAGERTGAAQALKL